MDDFYPIEEGLYSDSGETVPETWGEDWAVREYNAD
jgi:hypothetical protein